MSFLGVQMMNIRNNCRGKTCMTPPHSLAPMTTELLESSIDPKLEKEAFQMSLTAKVITLTKQQTDQ
jgi:hypothetical protein